MSPSTNESRDDKISRLAGLIATKGSRFNDLKLDQLLKLAGEADVSIDVEEEDGVPSVRAANGGKKRAAEFPDEEQQVPKRQGAIDESLHGDSQRPVDKFPPPIPAQPVSWAARVASQPAPRAVSHLPLQRRSERKMTEIVRHCHPSMFSRTDADRTSTNRVRLSLSAASAVMGATMIVTAHSLEAAATPDVRASPSTHVDVDKKYFKLSSDSPWISSSTLVSIPYPSQVDD